MTTSSQVLARAVGHWMPDRTIEPLNRENVTGPVIRTASSRNIDLWYLHFPQVQKLLNCSSQQLARKKKKERVSCRQKRTWGFKYSERPTNTLMVGGRRCPAWRGRSGTIDNRCGMGGIRRLSRIKKSAGKFESERRIWCRDRCVGGLLPRLLR